MKPIIVSLYMKNINPDVRIYQRKVIEKFRGTIPFYQMETRFTHGDSMEKIMQSILLDTDYDLVIFLDMAFIS